MSTEHMPSSRRGTQSAKPVQPETPGVPAIEDWLASHLSQRLGIPVAALDVHQPLTRYGLDSIVALELAADLEDWLGSSLPLTLVWDCPSIAAMAQCIAASAEPRSTTPPGRAYAAPTSGIGPPTTDTVHPLSYGQQALWFLHQQAPDSLSLIHI